MLPECTAPGQGQHPNPEGPQPAAGKPPPPAASQPARGAAKARPARRTGTAARVARQPLSTPASAVAAAGQPRSRGVVAGHCLLACRPARSGRAARRPRRAAQRRHHRPAAARATHPRVPGMPSRTQIQMRDIPGFVDTRYQLLQLKPNNRNHWISFAVGHHLDNNYEVAVQVRPRSGGRHHDDHTTAMPRTLAAAAGPGDHRSGARVRLLGARPSGRRRRSSPRTPASCLGDPQVINAYEGTQEEGVPASEAYEHSELLLYKAMVLQVGGGGCCGRRAACPASRQLSPCRPPNQPQQPSKRLPSDGSCKRRVSQVGEPARWRRSKRAWRQRGRRRRRMPLLRTHRQARPRASRSGVRARCRGALQEGGKLTEALKLLATHKASLGRRCVYAPAAPGQPPGWLPAPRPPVLQHPGRALRSGSRAGSLWLRAEPIGRPAGPDPGQAGPQDGRGGAAAAAGAAGGGRGGGGGGAAARLLHAPRAGLRAVNAAGAPHSPPGTPCPPCDLVLCCLQAMYRQLLDTNPDNYDYHRGLQVSFDPPPSPPRPSHPPHRGTAHCRQGGVKELSGRAALQTWPLAPDLTAETSAWRLPRLVLAVQAAVALREVDASAFVASGGSTPGTGAMWAGSNGGSSLLGVQLTQQQKQGEPLQQGRVASRDGVRWRPWLPWAASLPAWRVVRVASPRASRAPGTVPCLQAWRSCIGSCGAATRAAPPASASPWTSWWVLPPLQLQLQLQLLPLLALALQGGQLVAAGRLGRSLPPTLPARLPARQACWATSPPPPLHQPRRRLLAAGRRCLRSSCGRLCAPLPGQGCAVPVLRPEAAVPVGGRHEEGGLRASQPAGVGQLACLLSASTLGQRHASPQPRPEPWPRNPCPVQGRVQGGCAGRAV